MNTCANCPEKAVFGYPVSNSNVTLFCGSCAPKSPRLRARLVNLATQEEIASKVAEVARASKTTKTSTVINSTPIEEVVDSNSNENEPTEEEVTDNEPNE